jgi:hypothetical protein
MAKITGAEPNLRTDCHGMNLIEDGKYEFDPENEALFPMANGNIQAEHIKLARLMLVSPLAVILKIKTTPELAHQILHFSRQMARI